jgi:large subunit ribosomal protein L21
VYAVIESGGKQYRVTVGQQLAVEKLPVESGQQVTLDRVLMVATDQDVQIGRPVVAGAKVVATALRQELGPKVIVFKYKPKTRYRRKRGHRQLHTLLRIDEIIT